MKKKTKISLLLLILFTAFVVIQPMAVFASETNMGFKAYIQLDESQENSVNETSTTSTYYAAGYEDEPYERLGSGFDINAVDYGYVLPSKYDPRNNDDFVKDDRIQYNTELCWMYAPVNAAEILTAKTFGSKFEFSKAYGSVSLSKLMQPVGHVGGGYYNRLTDQGGYFSIALQYLTNWNTPIFNDITAEWDSLVAESDYPLSKIKDDQVASIDSDYNDATPILNVNSAKYLDSYLDYTGKEKLEKMHNIKYAVSEYGGVSVPFRYLYGNYSYNGIDYGYYYSDNEEDTNIPMFNNHAILIVGWDDNYSKNNFGSNKPSKDGAWLIKNSGQYRTYFWLSYEEGSIAFKDNKFMVITDVQKASKNEHMLSYDYLPVNYTEESFNENIYLCNVFDLTDYMDSFDSVNKVMIYYRSEKLADYKIKIVPVSSNGNIPTNINSYSVLKTGSFQGEGYLTAELNSKYQLGSSNKIAVVVMLSPKYNDSNIYIPYEGKYDNVNAEINSGESYFCISDQGNNIVWTDCNSADPYDITGNLVIRPVLSNSDIIEDDVSVSPTNIVDTGSDVNITVTPMSNLFSLHTSDSRILYENVDYVRNSTGITLKQSFINSLNDEYTKLYFDFTNDTQKSVVINPKSAITKVTIIGDPIVGDTLTSSIIGEPEKSKYEVSYQWQYSVNGSTWSNIYGATYDSYTIDENVLGRYIRLSVTPLNNYCNVESGNVSDSTYLKVVILGDVDLNGKVTIADSTLVQKYIADMTTLSDEQKLAADYNRDGRIATDDVMLIQKKAAGVI